MKITVTGQTTFVKRVTIGTPISSVNEAASGSVSGTGRSTGDILVVKSGTNLYEPGDLVGSHGIVKAHNTATNDLVLSVDSDEIKSIIDSAFISFMTGQNTSRNFVDSAYVEANSLDSERTNNLLDSELGALRVSLVPYNDSAIDLGDSSRKFRDLYLSGSTIHLGGLIIGDENTTFTVRDSAGAAASMSLAGNTTTDLAEGNNLYYTRARFDSALGDTTSRTKVRSYLNLIDAGGDGSLAYDSALGKITYTGPSAAEVRAHINGGHGIVYSTSTGNISVDSSEVRGLFSAGGDLSYNAGTGQFTFDVETVYTQANFESDLSLSLNATNGIAYDSARHKLSLINTGVDSAIYGSSTRVPVLTINAQGRVDSAGSVLVAGVTGVSFDSGTETITISTADGNSFSTAIGGYDNLQATTFTGTNATIDSAVVTDISGSSINYDSGSVNEFTATNITADSAVITDISGTSVNVTTGLISQLSADSARATVLTTPSLSADSARIINASGTGLNYTTAHLANITGDSARIGNMTITGDLTVSGTQTTINTQTVKVHDPIIHLADSNEVSDVVDLGFVGKYYRDGQQRHTGLIRDASNEQYYLFRDVVDSSLDSSLTINRSATGFAKADLNVASLIGDSATLTNLTVDSAVISFVSGGSANYDSGNINVLSVTTLTTTTVNADSSSIFDISGSSLNYDSGSVNQFTATNITADSAVITDVSGTTTNFVSGNIGQLTGDSASIFDISGSSLNYDSGSVNVFTATTIAGDSASIFDISGSSLNYDSGSVNQFTATNITADSAVITDISGTTINYDTGLISQLSTDSAYATRLEANIARINGISGDSASFTNLIAADTLTVGGKLIPIHVDSAYIETVSLDSERAIALIDSTYVNLRSFNLVRDEFKYTLVDAGTGAGPRIVYDRNSSSPADSDALTSIEFRGRNSADSAISYAQIQTFINDATADTEDAEMHFVLTQSGVQRTKMKFTPTGIVLAGNEKVAFSDDSFHQLLTPGNYTSDHALTLPDSTGTLLTREFITTLVDSNYVALRQGASIVNLEVDDSAGDQKILVPITQAPTIVTGSPIGFGNTISVLLADSSSFTISL